MKTHDLKTDSEVFLAVWNGEKTFEIRLNDRGFETGDILFLRETEYSGSEMKLGHPLIFTERQIRAKVSHVLRGPIYGLMEKWVILSLAEIRNIYRPKSMQKLVNNPA